MSEAQHPKQTVEQLAQEFGANMEYATRNLQFGHGVYFEGDGIIKEAVSPEKVLWHETSKNRFPIQFLYISNQVIARAENNLDTLIVSAPCSSGEEVYSVALKSLVALKKKKLSANRVKVLGLDAAEEILQQAHGLLNAADLSTKPRKRVNIARFLARSVEFRKQNFIEGLGFQPKENPQIILMNNIFYYLNNEVASKLLEQALKQLDSKNGILLTTHEDYRSIRHLFKQKKWPSSGSILFKKKGNKITLYELNRGGVLEKSFAETTLDKIRKQTRVLRSPNSKLPSQERESHSLRTTLSKLPIVGGFFKKRSMRTI
jgi:chemotaxis methyl-accepting protein methylase